MKKTQRVIYIYILFFLGNTTAFISLGFLSQKISKNDFSDEFSVEFCRSSIHRMFDDTKKKVDCFSQYGPLVVDVLGYDPLADGSVIVKPEGLSEVQYHILTTITNTLGQDRDTFSYLLCSGDIRYNELTLSKRYSFSNDISVFVSVPLYKVHMALNKYVDLTPDEGNGVYNKKNSDWNAFLNEKDVILQVLGVTHFSEAKKIHVGDVKLVCEHASLYNTQEEKFLNNDYVNVNIGGGVGIIIPTGKRVSYVDCGYKNHMGFNTYLFADTEIAPIVNLSAAIQAVFFLPKKTYVGIKRNSKETGFFSCYQPLLKEHLAPLLQSNIGCEIDLSQGFFVSFNYDIKMQGRLKYTSDNIFLDEEIMKNDTRFKSWYRNTFSVTCAYEYSLDEVEKYLNRSISDGDLINDFRVAGTLEYPFSGKNTPSALTYGFEAAVSINL